MNWTGGQLRRHSARGILSKVQRQNFAKSRQQTINGVPAQPLSFNGFQDGSGKDDLNTREVGEAAQTIESPGPRSVKGLPNTKLGILKRRLLQQPDWAAVSAARPLEITFPSVEEVGRVGKRRKLTDLDRKRLSSHRSPTLPGLFKSRKRGTPSVEEDVSLSHVKIHIDGHLAGSPTDNTQAVANHPSSFSMLLDNDEPTEILQQDRQESSPILPRKVAPGRISLQPRHSRVLPRFKELEILAKTQVAENSDPTGYSFAHDISAKVHPAQNSPCHSRSETDQSTSLGSFPVNAFGSPLPRRRFTIDDQLLAEQTSFNSHQAPISGLGLESSYGLRRTASSSPVLTMADAPFDPLVSSWLPQPQRSLRPSSPLNTRSSFHDRLRMPQFAVDDMPCLNISNAPLKVAENPFNPVPVKIFGQVVQLQD
ncbi:hypothetical protein N7454_010278 [Penicillium verhagenii]|nr:hypothetical protein N7454_010278 [Penicillium verhagenii]